MRNNQVNLNTLPETSKSSAFWDMGVDSHLKWLLLFSPNEAGELGRHQSKIAPYINYKRDDAEQSSIITDKQRYYIKLLGDRIHSRDLYVTSMNPSNPLITDVISSNIAQDLYYLITHNYFYNEVCVNIAG